jgi:hypothetical protein
MFNPSCKTNSQIQINMLKATLLPKPNSSYTKKSVVNGVETSTVVFRYSVSGTPEEMEAYKQAKGSNHRVDENTGQVLFFSTTYISDVVDLIILSNGDVIIDRSELRKAEAQVKAMGGNLGQAIAMTVAGKLFNSEPDTSEE